MELFNGRTVIVTGGGQGIGRAACEQFGELGANVVVNDIAEGDEADDVRPADDVVASIRDAGGTAVADYSDVGAWDGAEDLVDTAINEFGDLDVVYNNAGIFRPQTLAKTSEEDLDAMLSVHLKGSFGVLHHAADWWREQSENGTGRERAVVIASSDAAAGIAQDSFSPVGLTSYATVKAGLLGLTRSAAAELREYDVRVNAIWPMADTPMSQAANVGFPSPESVAAMVAYLTSDECRLTAETIRIAGERMDRVTTAPKPEQTAYSGNDIWTFEELRDRFEETVGRHQRQEL